MTPHPQPKPPLQPRQTLKPIPLPSISKTLPQRSSTSTFRTSYSANPHPSTSLSFPKENRQSPPTTNEMATWRLRASHRTLEHQKPTVIPHQHNHNPKDLIRPSPSHQLSSFAHPSSLLYPSPPSLLPSSPLALHTHTNKVPRPFHPARSRHQPHRNFTTPENYLASNSSPVPEFPTFEEILRFGKWICQLGTYGHEGWGGTGWVGCVCALCL